MDFINRATLYNWINVVSKCCKANRRNDMQHRISIWIMRKCFLLSKVITLLKACTRTNWRNCQRYNYDPIAHAFCYAFSKRWFYFRAQKNNIFQYIYFLKSFQYIYFLEFFDLSQIISYILNMKAIYIF